MKRLPLLFSLLILTACVGNRPVTNADRNGLPNAVAAAAGDAATSHTAPNPNGGRSPVWSPDGAMIAFISSTLHTPGDLWVMKADGTGARRLTTRGVQYFKWAQDGKSFMFVARRKGYEEVMTVKIDGSGESRVPGLPPNSSIPVYSPDGKLFAFTSPDEKKVRNLWIGTADGSRIEAVTENMGVRNIFWHQDSRKIFFEAGKSYGVGIWEIDLSTMESKSLLGKYIGTPDYSTPSGLIAYPYPTNPGEFAVQTMGTDGSDIKQYKAPRLAGRFLQWDAAGKGVYYLGQDIEVAAKDEKGAQDSEKEKTKAPPAHEKFGNSDIKRVGVTSLWHLDLASGVEKRVTPESIQVNEFSESGDGRNMLLSGVLEKSRTAEIFNLDTASGELKPLAVSRTSAWMPVPSPDAAKIAFFSNEEALETLKVANFAGDELASYPGFALEGDTRLFWLPQSEGLLVFSGRGIFAFTDKGPIAFPNSGDLRAYMYADVSIQEDKVLLSAIPRFGETPGLYMLRVVDGKFALTDLRFPSAPEIAADRYLQPRWSLSGEKIAFTDGIDVWVMKGDGTGRSRITKYAERNAEGKERPVLSSFPVWSVAADKLCYTVTVYEEKSIIRQLWLVNADGTGGRMLYSEELDSQFQVFQPEYSNQPVFDAADERVIFTAAGNGVPNVVSIGLKDGSIHRLTETGAIYPALLPDEGVIVFTSLVGNDESLWFMSSNGTEKRPFVFRPKAVPIPTPDSPVAAAGQDAVKDVGQAPGK